VIDALPRNIGDVEQAVDAAQVDERTVIGDVLDDALQDLAFFQRLSSRSERALSRLSSSTARRETTMLPRLAVHFQDEERLRRAHQRRYVS
jgi:hypothetical protein